MENKTKVNVKKSKSTLDNHAYACRQTGLNNVCKLFKPWVGSKTKVDRHSLSTSSMESLRAP